MESTKGDTPQNLTFLALSPSYTPFRVCRCALVVSGPSVYDVSRRESFTNLVDVWMKEVDAHVTVHECVLVLVGNKADKVSECGRIEGRRGSIQKGA